jgi:hypothetical protein
MKREWDEIDEQMAREGQAIIRRMTSVGQARRTGQDRDTLVPGKAHVPMKGTGAGSGRVSLGQVLWATGRTDGQ